tara:strand:+ start:285 stop:605 length:321 start_codon:yes stop_codon:yes gene_type:complete
MGQRERIIVRKIYLGSAAMFGLYYGLIIGLLAGGFVLIASLLMPSSGGLGVSGALGGFGIVTAGIVFVIYTVAGIVGSVISALLYNIISKIGGSIHVDLEEHVPTI